MNHIFDIKPFFSVMCPIFNYVEVIMALLDMLLMTTISRKFDLDFLCYHGSVYVIIHY